jgi:hypothetical protein
MIGAPLGLLSFRAHLGSDHLIECIKVFNAYAGSSGFLHEWMFRVHRDLAIMLLMWIVGVCSRAYTMSVSQESLAGSSHYFWRTLLLAAFAMNTLILCAIVSCVQVIIMGMTSSIDCYCTKVIRSGNLSSAVSRWNAVWAIVRQASLSLAPAMCVLEATIFLMLACAFLDIHVILSGSHESGNILLCINLLVPGGAWTLGICKVFFRAAKVSDMCNRVPSLLNSCGRDGCSLEKRHSIVQYVLHSASGFYLHEVMLTSGLLIKFAHLLAVAMFAFTAQFLW